MGRPKGKAGGVKRGKRHAKNEIETGEELQVPKKKKTRKLPGEMNDKTCQAISESVGYKNTLGNEPDNPIAASQSSFPMSQSTSGKFIPVFSKKKALVKPTVAQGKPADKKPPVEDVVLPVVGKCGELLTTAEPLAQPPEMSHVSEGHPPPPEMTDVSGSPKAELVMDGLKAEAKWIGETQITPDAEIEKGVVIPTASVLGPDAAENEDVFQDVTAAEGTEDGVKIGNDPGVGEAEDKSEKMPTVSEDFLKKSQENAQLVKDSAEEIHRSIELMAMRETVESPLDKTSATDSNCASNAERKVQGPKEFNLAKIFGEKALYAEPTCDVLEDSSNDDTQCNTETVPGESGMNMALVAKSVPGTLAVPETLAAEKTDFNHEAVLGITGRINIEKPLVPDVGPETKMAGSIGEITCQSETLLRTDSVEMSRGFSAGILQQQDLKQAVGKGCEADSVAAKGQEMLLRGLDLNSGKQSQDRCERVTEHNSIGQSQDKLIPYPVMDKAAASDVESSDEEFRNNVVESVMKMMEDQETGGALVGKECDNTDIETAILAGCGVAAGGDDVDGMDETVLNTASPHRSPANTLKGRVGELLYGASGDNTWSHGETLLSKRKEEMVSHSSEGQSQSIVKASLAKGQLTSRDVFVEVKSQPAKAQLSSKDVFVEVKSQHAEERQLSSRDVFVEVKPQSDGLKDYLVKEGILPRIDTIAMLDKESPREEGMTLDEALEEMADNLTLQEETLSREDSVMRRCVAEMKTITNIEDDLMMGLSDSQLMDFEDQAIEELKSAPPPQPSRPTLKCPLPPQPTRLAPKCPVRPQKTEGTAKVKQLTKDLSDLNMMMVKAKKDMEQFVQQHQQACHKVPASSANTTSRKGNRNTRF